MNRLRRELESAGIAAALDLEADDLEEWDQLVLRHRDGTPITAVERNPVGGDALGAEEINYFLKAIEDAQPASAVQWLQAYLRGVKTIYAFQILSGTEQENGWDAVDAVKNSLWSSLGGIFQADGEGFSNEEGYHILWQFADDVSGPWWMAVRQGNQWVEFEMELGNRQQRAAFLRGEVPRGANLRA